MPTEDADLLSAVTAGIAEAGGGPAPETTDELDNDTGDSTAGADDSGEADADGGAAPDAGETDASVDGSDATDQSADGVGDDKKKDGELEGKAGDPAATAKAGDKDKNPDGTPKRSATPDPLNDPLPNALKKETKERIQTLISTVKTTTAERDQAVADKAELFQHIQDTGATPEQYGETLGVLKMLNSNDPAQLEQALTYVQNVYTNLARQLGKPVPGVDMLASHEDLRAAVADGTILQQHAEELAAARDARQIQLQTSQQRTQTQQQNAVQQQAINEGKTALNNLGATLSKTDPQFNAKHAILKESLKLAIAKSDPSQWVDIYTRAYKALNLPTQRMVVPGTKSVNQPLRAKTPAGGGGERAASSMLDAVNSALGRGPTE